jgi:hypothetical protein
LFQKYSTGIYKLDKSKTRIYFPLVKISQSQEETKNTIIDILEENGYTVIDYLNGEVVNPKKKIVKIDVAFNTLGFLELKNRYKEDIVEHKKSKTFSVVISRLPYDIVGKSAHRRWSAYSCMNLYNNEGRYAEQYLPMDIKQGSLVAYLIRSEDTKILDPLARLTIRPYIGDKESDIVFDNATKVYLDDSDNDAKNNKNLFVKRVEEWILDVHESQDLSGIFQIKSGLYKDESNEMLNLANEEFKEKANVSMKLSPIHNSINTTNQSINTTNQSVVYNYDVLGENFSSKIKEFKPHIVYLDPPYNERQYSKNYFPLNIIAMSPDEQNDEHLTGKTGIPESCFISDFCKKTTVRKAFVTLFENLKNANAQYTFLSYSSESLISKEDMIELLSTYGTVSYIEKDYKRFKSFDYNEDKPLVEYLFCVKF